MLVFLFSGVFYRAVIGRRCFSTVKNVTLLPAFKQQQKQQWQHLDHVQIKCEHANCIQTRVHCRVFTHYTESNFKHFYLSLIADVCLEGQNNIKLKNLKTAAIFLKEAGGGSHLVWWIQQPSCLKNRPSAGARPM